MRSLQDFFFRRYLSPGDEIRAIYHRHFFVVLPNIFFWLLVPVCWVSYIVYRWYYPELLSSQFLWVFELYIGLLYLVMLYKILDWYGDAWVLTDRGLIDTRWSLFMRNMTFTEYHDFSGIESEQHTVFDKLFNIGDVTIHKVWGEIFIARMYRPDDIVELVQSNLHEHHHEEHKPAEQAMHIYLDWVRQGGHATPYKNGFRYMPADGAGEQAYVEKVRRIPGTIDLSGTHETPETDHDGHQDNHH